MNPAILHPKVQQFISKNLNTNTATLLFKGSPFDEVTIQEIVLQIVSKKKLPTWFQTENVYYPPKVHIEQTSSECTAAYKASLVSGNAIVDITGGFGVDCFYFSKTMKEVIHCELNGDLSTIVHNNYQQLKIETIDLYSGDGLAFLKHTEKNFDWVYIDPSRRNDANRKVFLLHDCLPNIPENLSLIFSKTTHVLIKNSPILDISKTIEALRFVKEIHIVAIENEVKELLFILEKNYDQKVHLKTINFQKNNRQLFDFKIGDQKISSTYSAPKKYIYEPNAAVLKSGGFHEISAQLHLEKLHPHSHLYTSNKLLKFPGRTFLVEHVIPYKQKEIKKYLKAHKANITTRNFPETVAQIRKKTKIKEGGSQYLFFTTINNGKHIVLITSQVFNKKTA